MKAISSQSESDHVLPRERKRKQNAALIWKRFDVLVVFGCTGRVIAPIWFLWIFPSKRHRNTHHWGSRVNQVKTFSLFLGDWFHSLQDRSSQQRRSTLTALFEWKVSLILWLIKFSFQSFYHNRTDVSTKSIWIVPWIVCRIIVLPKGELQEMFWRPSGLRDQQTTSAWCTHCSLTRSPLPHSPVKSQHLVCWHDLSYEQECSVHRRARN